MCLIAIPTDHCEEKIQLAVYSSSGELKAEIRRRVADNHTEGWSLVSLVSGGPYLYLKFQKMPAS